MRGALYRVASLVCLLAAGCSAGGTGGVSAPDNAKDFLAAYRDAVCDNVGSCCGGTGGPYSSAEACRQGFANVSVSSLTYDASKAKACLDAVNASIRACESLGLDGLQACHRALQGKTRPGEACDDQKNPYQCAQPADDSSVALCNSGKCQVIKRTGRAGDSCDRDATETSACDDATFCDGSTCVKREAEGEACSIDHCAKGLSCESDASSTIASLRCVKRGDGAACGPGGSCGYSFACDRQTCKCRARKAAGAECNCDSECLGHCDDGHCKGDANSGPSFCHGYDRAASCILGVSDAGSSSCSIQPPARLLTPDEAACKDSVPESVSPTCAACACSAGDTCPSAVMACDATCWGLIQCIQRMCPDFARMAMSGDTSCVSTNCADYLSGVKAATDAGMCVVQQCAVQCSP